MATYQLWIDDEFVVLLVGALDDLGQYGGRIEMRGNSSEFVSGSLVQVPPRSMSVGKRLQDVLTLPADLETQGEALARRFHELYEELAPQHGYETRKESAVPWDDVPAQNKALMTHVAMRIIEEGR